MAFAAEVVPLHFADPQGDATMLKWRAPGDGSKTTIRQVDVVVGTTLASGTANGHTVQLLNMGTAGTSVIGTITAVLGAAVSGTFPGWTAGTPVAATIVDGELDSGEWVAIKHDESGTVAPLNVDVMVHTVRGPSTI